MICLNENMIQLLEIAYLGMPTQKQKLVDAEIKAGVSREQAIFNEITNPRIVMYAEKGEKLKEEKIQSALQVLRGLGVSVNL